jgi:hypothetical protein
VPTWSTTRKRCVWQSAVLGPEFQVAFEAWEDTHPDRNPDPPRGPTYMPEYKPPEVATAARYVARAHAEVRSAERANSTSDGYVRITVFLARVLFLVGISTQFPTRGVRYGLIALSDPPAGLTVPAPATTGTAFVTRNRGRTAGYSGEGLSDRLDDGSVQSGQARVERPQRKGLGRRVACWDIQSLQPWLGEDPPFRDCLL